MLRQLAAVAVLVALNVAPAQACMRFASPAAIDQALAESQAVLTPAQVTTARALRGEVAALLAKRDYTGAKRAETRAMDILGRTFESHGPLSRGCQDGKWVPRAG